MERFAAQNVLFLCLIYPQKRQVEILKLRFGDAALQAPDVMLSDMQSSLRVNRQIYEDGTVCFYLDKRPVHLLSHRLLFKPPFSQGGFGLLLQKVVLSKCPASLQSN